MIIPSPISEIHSNFFNFDKTQKGGKKLMLNEIRNIFALNKKGFMMKGELTLRFGLNFMNSLEIVASFNKSLKNIQNCVLLTSRDGVIRGMTETAENMFQLGRNIFSYNEDLIEIYEVVYFFNVFFQGYERHL